MRGLFLMFALLQILKGWTLRSLLHYYLLRRTQLAGDGHDLRVKLESDAAILRVQDPEAERNGDLLAGCNSLSNASDDVS